LIVLLAIGILWALPATARDRPVIRIGIVDSPPDSETELAVGDVERLHDVLDKLWNDPAALGLTSSSATIQLAANAIYRLDPTKWEEGRVRLALGTEIRGGNQYTDDRDEDGNPGPDGIPDAIGVDMMGNNIFASRQTIIDGRGLTGERAVIEAGLENSIRNLTVWGARDPVPGGTNRPGAEIRLLLTDQDDVGRLTVDGVICEKGRRGIHVASANGAQMYLTARRSIMRDHADPADFAWGVQVSSRNFSGRSATLRHNRIYNNRIGIFLASVGIHDGEILLNSHRNVIEENDTGIMSFIRDFNSPEGSLRNHTRIHSTKDMIWNNRTGGGVNAVGYQRDANGIEIRDNETELQFLGTRFVKLTASGEFDGLQNRRANLNRRTDLRIVGAVLATPDLTGPTSGMSVRLLQRHTESSLMPTDYDSAPQPIDVDDNAPDVVDITIIGSQKRYLRTNEGVNELDENLFSRRR
jgi:hypothetical protein